MYNIYKHKKRNCGNGYRTASKAKVVLFSDIRKKIKYCILLLKRIEIVFFITIYFLSTDKFEKDLKTRKGQ